MERLDLAPWRTSSYSGTSGNNCVEVAESAGAVLVRDTKDNGSLVLALSADVWRTFISTIG